jgi:hypothetical protein
MQIVKGSGKNRTVTPLPHGSVFAQAAKDEPKEYKATLGAICNILGVG